MSAPLSLFSSCYRDTEGSLPLGKYIWASSYTRVHFRKNITAQKSFTCVKAQFCADGRFEIIVNGKTAYDSLDSFPIGKRTDSGVTDLTEFFTEGENKIAVRAYQTGTFDSFLSAFRGCIAIEYDNHTEYIKTDRSWKLVSVCSFWDDKEDEGWETADKARGSSDSVEYPSHPCTLRRSFYIRKRFCVNKNETARVILRATAYGLYEPYLNGSAVTDERFLPGAMDGCKEYRDFDITEKILDGENTIGAVIANGWYNCTAFGVLNTRRLSFMACIIIKDKNGNEQRIPTDESWMCNLSPLYQDDLQFGERYDARSEIDGWCENAMDDNGWVNAEEVTVPEKEYVHQNYPPIRVTQTLSPVSRRFLDKNRVIYDFGTNNAARGMITVKGAKRGDRILIRYAERLTDGEPHLGVYGDVYYISDTFRNGSARGALRNCDVYICKGDICEKYEPKFTYTGFRYIYLELPDGFDIDNIEVCARVIRNDLEVCGSINTSYDPLCRIWEMICRSFRSNTVGGPTDCPTREKNFWNGDIQAFCYTAMWYCDVNSYLSRWTDRGRKIEYGVYGWEDEEYILPYKLYKFYGNYEILKVKYPVMLALIEKRERQYLEHGNFPPRSARYRDHLSIVNVSHDFFAHVWHAYMYKLCAEISDILGEADKARELSAEFSKWRKSFNDKYFLEEENDYSEHCQSGIILPIMLGLAPEDRIPALTEKLVEYIRLDKGPTTGFFTTEYLLTILSAHGHTELAHDIMTRDTFPSWLYLWKTGSTTITESWHGEAGPYDESMNHYAFGSVGRYFFESLGGLKNHSGDMTHFDIAPEICEKIGDFGVSFKTPHGEVSTFWQTRDGRGSLKVVLPRNVCADITLPDGEKHRLCGTEKVFGFTLQK